MKHREAVAAVIIHEGKILCVQKGIGKHAYDSLKYEFPGGKIEKEETEEQAVIREVKEELNMDITVSHKLMTVDHQYPDLHISMHAFICNCKEAKVTLTEHVDYQWLFPKELSRLDWADAEIAIAKKLETI